MTLCINRKPNERVCIGSTIIITVQSIRALKVQLGIAAPKSLKVFRPEAHTLDVNPNFGLKQQAIISLFDCVAALGIPVNDEINAIVDTYAENFANDVIRLGVCQHGL